MMDNNKKTDKNKEIEKRIFSEFCQIMPWEYEYNDFLLTECPDFVSEDKEIGIELTEYQSDSELYYKEKRECIKTKSVSVGHKYENIEYETIKKAEEKYFSRSSFPAKVIVVFNDAAVNKKYIENKKNQDHVAEKLSHFVLKNIDYIENSRDFLLGINFEYEDLPIELRKIINFVRVETPAEGDDKNLEWENCKMAFMDIETYAISNQIRRKEEELERYRDKASKIYLLIYSSPKPGIGAGDGSGFAVTTGIDASELLEASFTSHFEGVYYFEGEHKDIYFLENDKFKKIT